MGVRDDLRQGALRFCEPASGAYLAQEYAGIPYLFELSELVRAADSLERNEATDDELQTLLRGGSSLGGARPKAHVLDQDGRIASAKFPSPTSDEWDVMRWEAVALQLARAARIRVPRSALQEIDAKAVHAVDRFDRVDGTRVGYVSAMTMLEATDGNSDGASYLDIAEIIETHSPQAGADLQELWRRIAFSVLIRNTDDHLRNHGAVSISSGFVRRVSRTRVSAPAANPRTPRRSLMRFMMFIYPPAQLDDDSWEPSADDVSAMMKYNEELTKAGVLLALDGLHPPSKGARVSISGGKKTVTDGPFTEAKEVVGGYWIIDVKSKDEAVEWASRCPLNEGDMIELRQVAELSDFPEDVQAVAELSQEPPEQTVAG